MVSKLSIQENMKVVIESIFLMYNQSQSSSIHAKLETNLYYPNNDFKI